MATKNEIQKNCIYSVKITLVMLYAETVKITTCIGNVFCIMKNVKDNLLTYSSDI